MARTEFTRKTKNEALKRAGYKCEASGPEFGFEPGQRCNCSLSLGVQFDHILPAELGGDNSLPNCQALCVQCHRFKTKSDIKRIRKSDRQRDRRSGVIRPVGKIREAVMESDIIERVARAILKARFYDCEPYMYGNDVGRFFGEVDTELLCAASDEARAAIEAMREPTDAMIAAGASAILNADEGWHSNACYRAMIDAALNGGSDGD